jgi:hypothetical protein
MEVQGGYGAVNNTFNNVEFKSANGRGLVVKNCTNTILNNPYFECGGNAIRVLSFSTFVLNNPIFSLYKKANTNGDQKIIYSESGLKYDLNGGTIFLTSEYEGITFYGSAISDTLLNINVFREPTKNGAANGFQGVSSSVFAGYALRHRDGRRQRRHLYIDAAFF